MKTELLLPLYKKLLRITKLVKFLNLIQLTAVVTAFTRLYQRWNELLIYEIQYSNFNDPVPLHG